ncbi:MAG: hypothetical protein CL607_27895 [Anaerolineaceae bacterium]|nr:hypothetical protein [Anaerolineaceae bacterium]
MLTEITTENLAKVVHLFAPLAAFNVAIPAAIDGHNWGYVLADDAEQPTAALMHTVEGTHIAGTPTETIVAELNRYLHEHYFTDERRVLYFGATEGWRPYLDQLCAPYAVTPDPRQHYVCTPADRQGRVLPAPENYHLRPIDAGLLNDPDLTVPDHIHSWVRYNWGSQAHYLREGFGMGIEHDGRIVSWSLADCRSGSRCEIGIQTQKTFRRQGLAAVVAAACADLAFAKGFTEVGWHCDADNIGSWKTAMKVGFVKERDNTMYLCRVT